MGQLFWVLSSTFLRHLQWFCLFKALASTSLQRLRDISFIHVRVVTSLQRVKLVNLTKVSICTLLQRLKLVGFFYVPMRRRKDVSNRFFSFKYQFRCRDDVSAWSQVIWDLNETLLRCRMLGGNAICPSSRLLEIFRIRGFVQLNILLLDNKNLW